MSAAPATTPWHAERAVNFPRGWLVRRADDSLVATVGVFGVLDGATEEEAQLIAAAPDLLQALNDCLAVMTALHTNEHHRADVIEAAHSAVAKAKGEA